MKIDIRSKTSLFIEINDKTFYIDDSTKESIMDVWSNCSRCKCQIDENDTIYYVNDIAVCDYCIREGSELND